MDIRKIVSVIMSFVVFAAVPALGLEPHLSQRGDPGTGSFDHVLDSEFSLYYLPEEEGAPLMSYIRQNEPPMLHDYTLEPEEPGPDDEITITAEIFNDPLITRSETMEVTLHYSLDEKETWVKKEMEDTGDGKLWTTVIPPIGEETTLYFYFVAMDDSENYYMEVPETDIEWASSGDEGFLNYIPDDNDVYTLVSDDLDILNVSLAFDGELVYMEMVVEGNISGGTVTPFEVNIYSAGFYVSDNRHEIGPKPTYVLEHAQHAQFITFPVIGLLDIEKRLAEIRTADARYYSHDNHLYMRMEKSVLDENGADFLRMSFGTAIGVNALPLVIDPRDVSCFINVVFGEHWIDIE